jgi:calcium/calmodulin-dependent protein kinase I
MSTACFIKGEFFLSPEIEKRGDELCPSRLREDYSCADAINQTSTFVTRQQTSSGYLNPAVRSLLNNAMEIEFISSSVSDALNEAVGDENLLSDVSFEPKGCIWTMNLNSSPDHQIRAVCCAREQGQITITYVVETNLLDKASGSIVSTGSKETQADFDLISHIVGKAVVRCEFPDFPEGCKDIKFKEVYKLNAKLKAGTHSTICRGIHRESGLSVCVKCVRRTGLPTVTDAFIYDEVALLSSVSHPHIVPLIDFFEEEDCYYLVKELETGGEILERVARMGSEYGEGDARDMIKNLLDAICVCHENKITHRDINPKNILLANEESSSHVKFTGFSFAARCHEPKSLKKQLGTPVFVAPEVLRNQPYDMEPDLWSLGVLAYLLLSGRVPFVGLNQRELFRNIVMGKFEFDEDQWDDVSPDGKAFVSRLLVVDPSKRMTLEGASKHLWMQLKYPYLQKRNLEDAAGRIKMFYEKQQIHKQESERNLHAGNQH